MKIGDCIEGKGHFSGYLCKHCGENKGSHKGGTYNCPRIFRSKVVGFLDKVYEEDLSSPVYVEFML